ncbi:MAG: dihydrofolate synthase / folylpolyglutamate synthase [Actinomycetota bacterium]|nr:dihydrofolate synthase / folylpolyglutamate synthase [Actinomycetota bacterium]
MNIEGALAYLDAHVNLETSTSRRAAARRLDRMRDLVGLMGDPQTSYPVIHLTGTNGKGSTARMLTALLVEKGLSVGTYTSPHLERINERMAWNGDPIDNASFVEVIQAVAQLEDLLESPPTHFEIITAAAYRWFADIAVDVAVVEVGLGGRWDATNVADGQVAAVTNVSLDHAEIIGPTLADIAEEKAGIIKPGSVVVIGETEPELVEVFTTAAFAASAESVWLRGRDFDCTANDLAHGGRHIELVTPGARYPGLFLPVHGAYQGENAAMALAAAEAFFGAPLDPDVVADALAAVRLPGRLEVVSRDPLLILDGAHNPAGAARSTAAIEEAFAGRGGRILVVGMLVGRDPVEMLEAFDAGSARLVVTCPPPSPRAMPAAEVAAAAMALGSDAEEAASVPEAVATALALASPDELVVVTGSLYVVGAARAALTGSDG